MDKIPMTQTGFTALEAELKRRIGTDRHEIVRAIAEARAHGDLSENAEYHAAKEQQSLNEGRINELEDALARAEIIDVSAMSGDNVKFGATLTLIDNESGKEERYQIVGEKEADVSAGKISLSSPLARALMGKEEGDDVTFSAPGGDRDYEILKIEYV